MPGVAGCPESVLEAKSQARVRPESVPNAWSRLWTPGVIAACHASLLDTQSQRCMRGFSGGCPESVLAARSRFWVPRVGPESVLNAWSRLWKPIVRTESVPNARSRFWKPGVGPESCCSPDGRGEEVLRRCAVSWGVEWWARS